MKLTIIVPDKYIEIDGVHYHGVDFVIDPSIHAVQFNGTYGWIEFVETEQGKPENQSITSIDAFASVIEAFYLFDTNAKAEAEIKQIANAARAAKQAIKMQAFIDNLPSWAVVGGKFDTMSAAVPTATNAHLKEILVELITTTKKLARVAYWLAKDTEE